jgi:hypothetical protein
MSTLIAESGFGDSVPNGVAGPLGLFITVLLVIATVLLIRNMNSRLRRLPESFPPPGGEPASSGGKSTEEAAAPPAAEGESPKP